MLYSINYRDITNLRTSHQDSGLRVFQEMKAGGRSRYYIIKTKIIVWFRIDLDLSWNFFTSLCQSQFLLLLPLFGKAFEPKAPHQRMVNGAVISVWHCHCHWVNIMVLILLYDICLTWTLISVGLSGDVEAADKVLVLRWRVGPQGEPVAVLWGGGGRVQVQRGLPGRATDAMCQNRKEFWRMCSKALKKGQTREMLAQRLALHLEVELRDVGDKLGNERKTIPDRGWSALLVLTWGQGRAQVLGGEQFDFDHF